MLWRIKTNDGNIISEYKEGNHTDLVSLDKSIIQTFGIYDTNKHLVHFDGASGRLELQNLNLQKLNDLKGGEKINLFYDVDEQVFKMDSESIRFYHDLILEKDKFNFVEFDQTGVININGHIFKINGRCNNEEFSFTNQPPYTDVHCIRDAASDFIGRKNSPIPYKRVDSILKHTIGYNKKHIYNNYIFNLSLRVIYDVILRTISMKVNISCEEQFKGDLIFMLDDKETKIPVSLDPNELAGWERIISLI